MDTKNILTLFIKQETFDEIVSGTAKQAFCEVTPNNYRNLVQVDEDDYEVVDENENAQPVPYDAIRFYVEQEESSDSALVEVEQSYCQIFVDDNDKPIQYEFRNPKTGKMDYWVEEQVVYNLGQIIEVNRK